VRSVGAGVADACAAGLADRVGVAGRVGDGEGDVVGDGVGVGVAAGWGSFTSGGLRGASALNGFART
jgi:hypothetical protein